MLQNIYKKLKRIFIKSTYSTSSGKILKKYGNQIITKVEIGKSRLPPYIKTIGNILSLGQLHKNLPFDLYHFFLKFTLTNIVIIVEKNGIINIRPWKYRHDTVYTDLVINNPMTLKHLMTKTKKQMGNYYYSFDFEHNNCEFFMIHLLQIMKIEVPPILNENYSNIYNNIYILKLLVPYILFIRHKLYYLLNIKL